MKQYQKCILWWVILTFIACSATNPSLADPSYSDWTTRNKYRNWLAKSVGAFNVPSIFRYATFGKSTELFYKIYLLVCFQLVLYKFVCIRCKQSHVAESYSNYGKSFNAGDMETEIIYCRVHRSGVRNCVHCSPCSTISKKWTVHTVRRLLCSHCSLFRKNQCSLVAFFVANGANEWTVNTSVRSSTDPDLLTQNEIKNGNNIVLSHYFSGRCIGTTLYESWKITNSGSLKRLTELMYKFDYDLKSYNFLCNDLFLIELHGMFNFRRLHDFGIYRPQIPHVWGSHWRSHIPWRNQIISISVCGLAAPFSLSICWYGLISYLGVSSNHIKSVNHKVSLNKQLLSTCPSTWQTRSFIICTVP